jgi:surfeit locus 1 family protein
MQLENLICNFKMNIRNISFRPKLIGAIITTLLAALFIKFGSWQMHKAEYKLSLQKQYNKYDLNEAEDLPRNFSNPDELRYKKVRVSGRYLPQYEILLDNQFDGERSGYYVITPLQIEGSKDIVLINRGWIEASENHAQVPYVNTPISQQYVEGSIWVPSQKFYTLEKKSPQNENERHWNKVWQNMDLTHFSEIVPMKTLPFIIRMSPNVEGGFARNWVRPDDRIETHLSYAYQWYGFALASVLIYLYLSTHRIHKKIKHS